MSTQKKYLALITANIIDWYLTRTHNRKRVKMEVVLSLFM